MTRTRLKALLGCAVWLAPCLAACVGTRTGNPYEHAPEYTTSSRFATDLPATPGGTDNGGLTGGPWGVPAYQHAGGDLVALFEHYVALAVSGRGVLTVDIADPAAPKLVGELPIDGTIFQLEAAADGVTVAVLERTAIDVTELPEAPLPREVPRLVRVDLSDPTHPRRAFAVDLEGAFFALDVRGPDLFVTEALRETDQSWCEQGGGLLVGEIGYQPATMKVVHYVASASGFEQREAVELPSDVGGALSAGDSYLVVDDYQTDAPLVRWVDFGSGSLVQGEPFRLTGRPRAADREGDVLALVLAHGDSSLSLELYTLAGSVAQPRGSVSLPQRDTAALSLLASGGAIIDGDGAPALLVDLADLDAPRVASRLPSEVMRLVEAPVGLLGLGSSDGPGSAGSLVVSLWDASDLAAPMQLSRVQTDWFYPSADPGFGSWTLDAERGLLLVPFDRPEGDPPDDQGLAGTGKHLGVFELDGSGVALYGEQASQTEAWRPWTDGQSVFTLAYEGFEVLPLVEGVQQGAPVSALLALRPATQAPIDELELDGIHVALREREDDGVFYLDVTQAAGGEPAVLELPHRGDALVQVGHRVVVLGMRGVASECELFEQQGVDPAGIVDIVGSAEHFDPCGSRRARGVSVVALDGEPRIVESFPFLSTMDIEPLDDVQARAELDGYVPLQDGRILLLAQRTRQCNSHASCDALGVPAYESMATSGCSSNEDCSGRPSVFTLVSGYENTLAVYVLDGVGGASPTLSVGAALDGSYELFDEGPLDVRRKLLSSEGTLALTRAQPVYGDDGNSIRDEHGDALVRYSLDRVVLHDDGSLTPLPSVSTPGLPIALRDDEVFCLEPRHDGEADAIGVVLHRAGLHGAGAFIESTVELGTGFIGAYVQGEHAYALRYSGDPCVAGTSTELSAIALATSGELERADGLELPGVFWRFAPAHAAARDTLWLAGGPHPDALLALDLENPAQPVIRRYMTPAR